MNTLNLERRRMSIPKRSRTNKSHKCHTEWNITGKRVEFGWECRVIGWEGSIEMFLMLFRANPTFFGTSFGFPNIRSKRRWARLWRKWGGGAGRRLFWIYARHFIDIGRLALALDQATWATFLISFRSILPLENSSQQRANHSSSDDSGQTLASPFFSMGCAEPNQDLVSWSYDVDVWGHHWYLVGKMSDDKVYHSSHKILPFFPHSEWNLLNSQDIVSVYCRKI